jgi:hypothetical protein
MYIRLSPGAGARRELKVSARDGRQHAKAVVGSGNCCFRVWEPSITVPSQSYTASTSGQPLHDRWDCFVLAPHYSSPSLLHRSSVVLNCMKSNASIL